MSRSARGRTSSRGQGTQRGAPAGRIVATSVWQGQAFYVQIERCCGVSEVVSVRLDEDKYVKHSQQLKSGLERYFDGQLSVEILDVPTLYALEVRVMPDEAHPRHGRRFVSEAAEGRGGRTVYSKIATKKWPSLEGLVQLVKDFCRVPVRITLLGKEAKENVPEDDHRSLPRRVLTSVNSNVAEKGRFIGAEPQDTVGHATLYCMHAGQLVHELHTDAVGQVETILYPGAFFLVSGEDGNYDRLTPDKIAVPSRFALLDIAITASMKKKCTFFVVDHLNRPFPSFPLKLTPKDASVHKPLRVQTQANGRGRGRLGRGIYVVSYDPPEDMPPEAWLVTPLRQELEVQDGEAQQYFQLCVHRVRFSVEIMLRTRFQEPMVLCPFVVKSLERGERVVARGTCSDVGLARCELPSGSFIVKLVPGEELPFLATSFDIHVTEDGSFAPREHVVETKSADVAVNLITPDGLPAAGCTFHLAPKFGDGGGGRSYEMSFKSDDEGRANATMSLMEPYIFRVKDTGKAAEYMPQEFVFMTDRPSFTSVVARTIFGSMPEKKIALVVDSSGSMASYLADVKAAMNLALVQQFNKSDRLFNIVTYTGKPRFFRKELVECTPSNIEDAMRFCEQIEAGGQSSMIQAIASALRLPGLEALYIVTDGKCDLGEEFLGRAKSHYFACAGRPRINTIGINCPPQRLTYRGLKALAMMTQSTFRAVCLEQDPGEPVGQILGPGGSLDTVLHNATTDEEGGGEDHGEDDGQF